MSWILKVSHRLIPDKEFTRELRIDPDLSVIQLILAACRAFDFTDYKNYRIQYKKVNIPLLDSIKGTGVIQGCSLILVKRACNLPNYTVTCNFQIHADNGIIKSLTEFSSDTFLLEALQNVPVQNTPFNTLIHSSKLPVVSILGTKLKAHDLMLLENFTLSDLEMKGRYVVSIHYISEVNPEFQTFLERSDPNLSDHKENANINITDNTQTQSKTVSSSCIVSVADKSDSSVSINSNDSSSLKKINFKAYKIVAETITSEDLPDSFYDLSSGDLTKFQKGYKKTTHALVDKPFMSAKNNDKIIKQPAGLCVNIKFVFADQVQIHTSFPSDSPRQGPPYKLIQNTDKTIFDSGIRGASRIIVKCDKTPIFNSEIRFEKCN